MADSWYNILCHLSLQTTGKDGSIRDIHETKGRRSLNITMLAI